MLYFDYMMCQHRRVTRVVQHSSFVGEFVFRPCWENLGLLSAAQCEELTRRFHENFAERGMPDLIILLRVVSEKALQRIAKKQHGFEVDVTLKYLEALNKNFDEKYLPAIKDFGGTVIQLTVDIGEWTATPEDLLKELREKLRTLNDHPRASELRKDFGCKEEEEEEEVAEAERAEGSSAAGLLLFSLD